jgi:hypothetical protein
MHHDVYTTSTVQLRVNSTTCMLNAMPMKHPLETIPRRISPPICWRDHRSSRVYAEEIGEERKDQKKKKKGRDCGSGSLSWYLVLAFIRVSSRAITAHPRSSNSSSSMVWVAMARRRPTRRPDISLVTLRTMVRPEHLVDQAFRPDILDFRQDRRLILLRLEAVADGVVDQSHGYPNHAAAAVAGSRMSSYGSR